MANDFIFYCIYEIQQNLKTHLYWWFNDHNITQLYAYTVYIAYNIRLL